MLLSDLPGEFGGLYTRSEYDAFVVGEFRAVRSYCPVRHTWVVDYAAPIVAATVSANDPDAVIDTEERFPEERKPPTISQRRSRKRNVLLRNEIADMLSADDLPTADIAMMLGVTRGHARALMDADRRFVVVGSVVRNRARESVWGLRVAR